jgi:transposase
MVHTMKTVTGISGRQRRQHERSFKAEMVAQCLVPGASVAAVALAGGVNANLLFKWRRDHLRAMRACGAASSSSSSSSSSSTVLVPVHVAPDVDSGSQLLAPASPATAVPVARATRNAGVIELDIGGVQLRLRGPVDEASLCSVLRALRNRP